MASCWLLPENTGKKCLALIHFFERMMPKKSRNSDYVIRSEESFTKFYT